MMEKDLNLSDCDKLKEECGVFGISHINEASNFVVLGLHALQHRGQEGCGIASYSTKTKFHIVKRFGYVCDNFTKVSLIEALPGLSAIGHVRYSTSGLKNKYAIQDVQPLFAEFSIGGLAIAHNGNITNANSLKKDLIKRGSIFQSSSDSECIIHLIALSEKNTIIERIIEALNHIEGAFSIVAMTDSKLIGIRDPLGLRPLVLGKINESWVLSSETCALDIIDAEFVREVAPGEIIVISNGVLKSYFPFKKVKSRFCIFEYVYFSRPDSIFNNQSMYETRRNIGIELANESPIPGDLICPVPDSGIPAAIGYSQKTNIPYSMGITRNQYTGRTFIEPTEHIRNMGVKLKLNVNKSVVKNKKIVLIDDSIVRGTTSRKIIKMLFNAGAKEVHFRIASPPIKWPCFYGIDTPQRDKLLAAIMSKEEMLHQLGATTLEFITLDGLYKACGKSLGRDNKNPQYCDACFSGDYPTKLPTLN